MQRPIWPQIIESLALPNATLLIKRSYPGGNFEENQQLNDSISISPLYTTVSIDLHVRTPVELPPVFQQASFSSCIDHHLSGCIRINFAQILQKNSDRPDVPRTHFSCPLPSCSLSFCLFGFLTKWLSTLMHSLIRVTRRDIWRVRKRSPHFCRPPKYKSRATCDGVDAWKKPWKNLPQAFDLFNKPSTTLTHPEPHLCAPFFCLVERKAVSRKAVTKCPKAIVPHLSLSSLLLLPLVYVWIDKPSKLS